jgi:hypothetical protein
MQAMLRGKRSIAGIFWPKKHPIKPWPPLPVFSPKQTRHANDHPATPIAAI